MKCVGRNGTNGCNLSVFSVEIAFVCHFAAPYPPYRSACSIGYASKKLSNCIKWQAIQLTIQSTADVYIDRL